MIDKKVLVTTQHRGVFFGTLKSREGTTVVLADGRNCLYWPSSCHGFIGLATGGPESGSRVGPAASELELFDVTSITPCTDAAIAKWEAAPWS